MSIFNRLSFDHAGEEGSNSQRYSAPSFDQTVSSIKRNLEVILNSRKGCSLSSPGLGLQDFNDFSSSSVDMCIQISKDIRNSIEAYEPRLKVKEVEYLPSSYNLLQIGFRVVCSIVVKNKLEQQEIELLLDSANRKFHVS
jgi:type VI secretion system protein